MALLCANYLVCVEDVLRALPMILSRFFRAPNVLAAAMAASAVFSPVACAKISASGPVDALIPVKIPNTDSRSATDTALPFSRHDRGKSENALTPIFVRNPFLPANAIQSAKGQGHSGIPAR